MTELEKQELIQKGRDFLHYRVEQEEIETDQKLKRQQPPLVKAPMRDERISLPKKYNDMEVNNDFMDIINRRKSHRVYTSENISLLQLSYLLWATQGVKDIRGKSYATLRTVPSGGARHGFETYLIVRNCQELKPGKYHYLPLEHALEFLGDVDNMEQVISDSLCGQVWASKASVVFYWSFVPYRCEWRYGVGAHRPAMVDAGHIGQNLYLACTALGLGTCAIAAYDNTVCDPLFELDGNDEFIVYTCPVGTISEKNKEAENAFYAFVKEEGL